MLQRNTFIPVWGMADANERIEIRFNEEVKFTRADKNGRWQLKLDAENAGGSFEMVIKGKNIIVVKNILVGEVWLCSEQSNMEWPGAFINLLFCFCPRYSTLPLII